MKISITMLLLLFSLSLKAYNPIPLLDYIDIVKKNILLKESEKWIGTKYKWGGTDKNGIDCSAFVQTVYRDALNIPLPRVSRQQYNKSYKIDKTTLEIGDLVFFRKRGKVFHVGIIKEIDGNNIKFIHSSSSRGVTISNLNKGYWNSINKTYGRYLVKI